MRDPFDAFRKQLILSDLGELRTRQKMEFYPKVAAHAYHDEMRKLSSAYMAPLSEHLAIRARIKRCVKSVSEDE
jgi:hypothetical protein